MEREAMMPPASHRDPWAVLAQAVDQAAPEQCPRLIGELERLKASLWLRMAAPAHRQATPQPDCLLTAEEVAQRLRVTKEYVYRHARKYPFTVREGRYVRFSQAGLTRYLDRHQGK